MKKIVTLIIILTLAVNIISADTNSNGVGETTNSNGVGQSTNDDYNPNIDPNAYDPNVDPSIYGDQTPSSKTSGFNSGKLDQNPFAPSANGTPKLSLAGLIYWLVGLLNQVVYLIIGLALVSFLYGILKMSFIDGHKPEAREQARKFMFWGIVSLFVMMSVWGIVNVLKISFFGSGDLIIPRLK